jgi:solute carrier family 25 phosphate transporter 23/24/25/41
MSAYTCRRLHDTLKRSLHTSSSSSGVQSEPRVLHSLACGVVAAWSGQLVAFPLETVSRRMQLAGAHTAAAAAAAGTGGGSGATAAAAAAAAANRGVLAVLASVLQEGGWAGLYRWVGWE